MQTRSGLLLAVLINAGIVSAHAENLADVYRKAAAYDAPFAAAQASYRASLEKIPQARAALLPQVSASGNLSRINQQNTMAPQTVTYNSPTWGVNAVQTLFNKQSLIQLDEAHLQARAAADQLAAAGQNLVLRVAQAYFNVLRAQDDVASLQAQKAAISKQLAYAKRAFEVGTATITDTNEAQARFDLATAQEIAAENQLEIARRTLDTLTGQANGALSPLAPKAIFAMPSPGPLDSWVNEARTKNANVRLQESLRAIADKEVQRNRAGHYPTLALTAGYQDQNNQHFGAFAYNNQAASIGLQLNIPIYQGGLITAQTREAAANQDKAQQNLDDAVRTALLAARQAYLNVTNGAAQVKALEQALHSSEVSLNSTITGLKVGVRTSLDVLNAQQQVYTAWQQLSAAKYTYLLSTLQLKDAAGTLSPHDLTDLDRYLKAGQPAPPQVQ